MPGVPNLFERGKPCGGRRPAWARSPSQSLRSAIDRTKLRPDESIQVSPSAFGEDAHVGDAAVLVFLQPDALAARHLRHLVEREEEELPVLAEGRHHVAARGDAEPHLLRRVDRHHLLALAGIGEDLGLRHDEAPPLGRGDEQLPLRIVDEDRDHVLGRVHVDHQPDRLAVAAAARQLVALERVEAPAGRGDEDLVGGLRRERELERVVALEGERRRCR